MIHRAGLILVVCGVLLSAAFWATAQEAINSPSPAENAFQSNAQVASGAPCVGCEQTALDDDPNVISDPRFFPAIYVKRRFGPVEEPEQEFFALRNEDAPGFDWNPPSFGWGGGWGGWGFGNRFAGGWNFGVPRFGFGFVGYNRYAYRPWYASPNRNVWSNRYPWYSPGGAGPNIYQPWYYTRATLPWYSPFGVGPNIYTPTYQWQANYPWFSPNGPGPNIYTPPEELGGCLYW